MDPGQASVPEAFEVIDTLVTQGSTTGVSCDPFDLRKFLPKVIQNGKEIIYGQNKAVCVLQESSSDLRGCPKLIGHAVNIAPYFLHGSL